MAEPTTKICDACDAEISILEEKCPKCGIDFDELEETVASVSKAQEIIEKRKKNTALPEPPVVTPPAAKRNVLRSLGNALRKKESNA